MTQIITKSEWIENWQANRRLTRRIIEAFPKKDLFEFSIGGMRPFSKMIDELLYIADLTIKQIQENQVIGFTEYVGYAGKTKTEMLQSWDKTTLLIEQFGKEITEDRFREVINLFGMFNFPIIGNLTYLVENEIHHRGQGYVYLKALGIEPPAFHTKG